MTLILDADGTATLPTAAQPNSPGGRPDTGPPAGAASPLLPRRTSDLLADVSPAAIADRKRLRAFHARVAAVPPGEVRPIPSVSLPLYSAPGQPLSCILSMSFTRLSHLYGYALQALTEEDIADMDKFKMDQVRPFHTQPPI